VLVGKAVVGAAAEEVVARMRVNEEALATVYMAEIHSAMDMVIEPLPIRFTQTGTRGSVFMSGV
jgi:hypothetical protein